MTYRIDNITKTSGWFGIRWHFDFKGLRGTGTYADFYSGTDGKGLYWLGAWEGLALVDESIEFDCPLDLTDGQAYFRFCAVLDKLGWGPEDTPWLVCKAYRFTQAELQDAKKRSRRG